MKKQTTMLLSRRKTWLLGGLFFALLCLGGSGTRNVSKYAIASEGDPDPDPNVEATECPGEPYEDKTWTTHAQITDWTCDEYGLASYSFSYGSFVVEKTDACGQTTSETGSSTLEWDDVRTVTDANGSHDEYKFVEVDSDGNYVGETDWLTPDCCGAN